MQGTRRPIRQGSYLHLHSLHNDQRSAADRRTRSASGKSGQRCNNPHEGQRSGESYPRLTCWPGSTMTWQHRHRHRSQKPQRPGTASNNRPNRAALGHLDHFAGHRGDRTRAVLVCVRAQSPAHTSEPPRRSQKSTTRPDRRSSMKGGTQKEAKRTCANAVRDVRTRELRLGAGQEHVHIQPVVHHCKGNRTGFEHQKGERRRERTQGGGAAYPSPCTRCRQSRH